MALTYLSGAVAHRSAPAEATQLLAALRVDLAAQPIPQQQAAILRGLSNAGDEADLPAVLACLATEDRGVRAAAAEPRADCGAVGAVHPASVWAAQLLSRCRGHLVELGEWLRGL
jgi:hypothetical protein